MKEKDERGPVREIGRWLRGLEGALRHTLSLPITAEEREHLSQRRGIYAGIADDIDNKYGYESGVPTVKLDDGREVLVRSTDCEVLP